MITIQLSSPAPADINKRQLSLVSKELAKIRPQIQGVINVQFVNEADSRKYNKRYAGNDYPTDVLSFSYNELKLEQKTNIELSTDELGDIVICTPIARQQASEHNIELQAELLLLLVHGCLHILDLDHSKNNDKTGFANYQNAIMKALNLPAREYF